VKIVGALTLQTQTKLEAAIDRVLDEFAIDDYDRFIGSIEDEILYALLKQSGAVGIFPRAKDIETFRKSRHRIATRQAVSRLLEELKEPTPEELRQTLQALRELPSRFKRVLKETDVRIRPRGGPEEVFSDPVEIYDVTDEIFDRQKKGEKIARIKKDIAKREDISLSTLDRRVREELLRRAELLNSEKSSE